MTEKLIVMIGMLTGVYDVPSCQLSLASRGIEQLNNYYASKFGT